MCRKLLVIALVLQLALPPFTRAGEEDATQANDNRRTEKLIWGALSVLNFALVTSSFVNLQFYGDRANELEEVGLDADPFWDASNREKLVLGISTLSFVFTLAAWKKSFDSPGIVSTPLMQQPESPRFLDEKEETPEPEGENTAFLAFDSRVRYDTLFSGTGHTDPSDIGDGQVHDLFVTTRVDTVFPDETITLLESPKVPDEQDAESDVAVVAAAELESPAESAEEKEVLSLEDDPVAQLLGSKPPADLEYSDASLSEITLPAETLVTTLALPEPAGDTVSYPFEIMPYAVHVSSFRSMEQAEVEEAQWEKRGYLVLVEDAEVNGAIWYRVHVGNFASRAEARVEASHIQERYRHDFARVTKREGF